MSFGEIAKGTAQSSLNVADYLNKKISALVSTKEKGISGWVFDIDKNASTKLSADITDHYMEDNSVVNDHIVRKPIEVTLTGLIGELVYKKPEGIVADISMVSGTLSIVDTYLGDYSPQALQKANLLLGQIQKNANMLSQLGQKAQNMVKAFSGDGQYKTMQQVAYNELKALYDNDKLLTLQTPHAYYENMKIKDLSFTQDEDSESYSDISVTLKEIRFAKTTTTKKNTGDNRNGTQEMMLKKLL